MKSGKVVPRVGYTALSSQLARVQPTSTLASQYTPSSIPPTSCHNFTMGLLDSSTNVTQSTEVATILPSKPYKRLCSCMMETLNCTVNQNFDITTTYEKWKTICSENSQWCQAVRIHGAWQGCNFTEKFSWSFNTFNEARGSNSNACSSVDGVLRESVPIASLARDCQSLLRQAGSDGMGRVTSTPIPLTDSLLLIPEDNKSSPLTKGFKIGLGFGIGFSIIFIILTIFLCFYFRAKRKKHKSASKDPTWQKAELDGQPAPTSEKTVEQLASNELNELDSPAIRLVNNELQELDTNVPTELPTTDAAYELPSNDNQVVEMGERSPSEKLVKKE
jgi:hypothetical protein